MHVCRGGEARLLPGCFRARGRHNKRKPEVAADRFWPRSVVDLEKVAARRDAAAARHGTRHEARPDCVATTCELPTDAGVATPTYYPSTDVARPREGMLLCAELVNDARSLIPSVTFSNLLMYHIFTRNIFSNIFFQVSF